MIIWEVQWYDVAGEFNDGPIVSTWCSTRGVAVKERRRLVDEDGHKLSEVDINKHDVSSDGGTKNLVCRAMAIPKGGQDSYRLT